MQFFSCTRPTCWQWKIVEYPNTNFFLRHVSSCVLTASSGSNSADVSHGLSSDPYEWFKNWNTIQTNCITHVNSCNKNHEKMQIRESLILKIRGLYSRYYLLKIDPLVRTWWTWRETSTETHEDADNQQCNTDQQQVIPAQGFFILVKQ